METKFFVTEIRAVDPVRQTGTKGNIVDWSGPVILASSLQQAEEYCLHKQGYLKVVGQTDEPKTEEPFIDARNFYLDKIESVPEEMINCAAPEPPRETDRFTEGDVVMLKSGGPLMTVKSVEHSWVSVQYFIGTDLMEFECVPATLTLIN